MALLMPNSTPESIRNQWLALDLFLGTVALSAVIIWAALSEDAVNYSIGLIVTAVISIMLSASQAWSLYNAWTRQDEALMHSLEWKRSAAHLFCHIALLVLLLVVFVLHAHGFDFAACLGGSCQGLPSRQWTDPKLTADLERDLKALCSRISNMTQPSAAAAVSLGGGLPATGVVEACRLSVYENISLPAGFSALGRVLAVAFVTLFCLASWLLVRLVQRRHRSELGTDEEGRTQLVMLLLCIAAVVLLLLVTSVTGALFETPHLLAVSGIAMVALTLVVLALRRAGYEPEGASATQWHARRVIFQGVVLLSVITYNSGFALAILTFNSVHLDSEQLDMTEKIQMASAMTLHVALILGLIYQCWLHLRLVPVKQYTSSFQTEEHGRAGRSSLMASIHSDTETGHCGSWEDPLTGRGKKKGICCLCAYCPVSAMCNPCGHAVMCFNCAVRRIDTARPVCPLCQEHLTDIFECPMGDETAEA